MRIIGIEKFLVWSNDETIKMLKDIGISMEAIDNEQNLERYFVEIIESVFSRFAHYLNDTKDEAN